MKKKLILILALTPFFLFSSENQGNKSQEGRPQSAIAKLRQTTNPLGGVAETAGAIVELVNKNDSVIVDMQNEIDQQNENTQEADQILQDVDSETKHEIDQEEQQHAKESKEYLNAEEKYEKCQKCKHSPICCCCLLWCPQALECGCWEKPKILKRLDEKMKR